MKRGEARRFWWRLAGSALVLLAACGEGSAPPQSAGNVAVAGEAEDVEPAPAEIFLRQPASADGHHQVLHLLVPAQSSRESIRQMLFERLTQEGRNNSEIAALRAVVYLPRQSGPDEAELEPVAWAEWVPPDGWAGATLASRSQYYRVYSYFDAPPGW
jgi:hypothetical protein